MQFFSTDNFHRGRFDGRRHGTESALADNGKTSDLSPICLHSIEFNFLQEGGCCEKKINKEMPNVCKNRHECMVGTVHVGAKQKEMHTARPGSPQEHFPSVAGSGHVLLYKRRSSVAQE